MDFLGPRVYEIRQPVYSQQNPQNGNPNDPQEVNNNNNNNNNNNITAEPVNYTNEETKLRNAEEDIRKQAEKKLRKLKMDDPNYWKKFDAIRNEEERLIEKLYKKYGKEHLLHPPPFMQAQEVPINNIYLTNFYPVTNEQPNDPQVVHENKKRGRNESKNRHGKTKRVRTNRQHKKPKTQRK